MSAYTVRIQRITRRGKVSNTKQILRGEAHMTLPGFGIAGEC